MTVPVEPTFASHAQALPTCHYGNNILHALMWDYTTCTAFPLQDTGPLSLTFSITILGSVKNPNNIKYVEEIINITCASSLLVC